MTLVATDSSYGGDPSCLLVTLAMSAAAKLVTLDIYFFVKIFTVQAVDGYVVMIMLCNATNWISFVCCPIGSETYDFHRPIPTWVGPFKHHVS